MTEINFPYLILVFSLPFLWYFMVKLLLKYVTKDDLILYSGRIMSIALCLGFATHGVTYFFQHIRSHKKLSTWDVERLRLSYHTVDKLCSKEIEIYRKEREVRHGKK